MMWLELHTGGFVSLDKIVHLRVVALSLEDVAIKADGFTVSVHRSIDEAKKRLVDIMHTVGCAQPFQASYGTDYAVTVIYKGA